MLFGVGRLHFRQPFVLKQLHKQYGMAKKGSGNVIKIRFY